MRLLFDVKTKLNDVARSHDIVAAFGAEFASATSDAFGARAHKVVVVDNLRGDKAFFKISVNDASGLWCRIALMDRPGADFFLASGQVAL